MKPADLNEDRPTVVLMHSSASSPRQWQELVEALRRDYRVLAIEFHGHGMRPDWRGEQPMTLADEAALAVPLLEMAGGAHVVGHSYGAAVALKLASLYPNLVRSFVGYEPVLVRLLFEDMASHRQAQEVLAIAEDMRHRVLHDEPELAARHFVDFWSGAGAWQALPAIRQEAITLRMPSVVRHFDVLFAEPFPRHQLEHMDLPMLFLSGARTVPAARRVAQLLRMQLPLAEHRELPGLGHMGPITHAAQVNRSIQNFLYAHASRHAVLHSTAMPF
jgi:pimeloyl-ACP methyl ester carboxylesterase